jgi:hydroxymethylpyrimidine kinase/phosphomethylpyrimidine kinase
MIVIPPFMSKHRSAPVALSIAGFDPSGGAGIIADVRTFAAFDCFPTAAITSLTFQNTVGVRGAIHQTAAAVREQVLPVIEDFEIACLKTGMLPTREVIEEVARILDEHSLPGPVVDPVVRSTSGYDLIDDEALKALVEQLFPLAVVVTPNIPEAERITGLRIDDEDGLMRAGEKIIALGAEAVLLKGGHWFSDSDSNQKARSEFPEEREAADLLLSNGQITWFRSPWQPSTSTHGTGCTLSAAIAAGLGKGADLETAIVDAKAFVSEAIRTAPGLGHGHGPLNLNPGPRSRSES